MRALLKHELDFVVGGQSQGGGSAGGGSTGGSSTGGGTQGGVTTTQPSGPSGGDRTIGRESDGGVNFFEGAGNRVKEFLDNPFGQAGEVLDEGLEWIERNNMGTSGAYQLGKVGTPEPL